MESLRWTVPAGLVRRRLLRTVPAMLAVLVILLLVTGGRQAWIPLSSIGGVVLWVLIAASLARPRHYEASVDGIAIVRADGRRRSYAWSHFRDWQQHGALTTGPAFFLEPRTARLGRYYYLHPRSFWRWSTGVWASPEADAAFAALVGHVLPEGTGPRFGSVLLAAGACMVLLLGAMLLSSAY